MIFSMRHFSVQVAVVSALSFASQARANCARGDGYDVLVESNTVRICPWNQSPCGTYGAMLRQNVETGEIVQLVDSCVTKSSFPNEGSCFVDECVPAGNYRYGFENPYECNPRACGTTVPYWEPAVVSEQLGTCSRTSTTTPIAFSAKAPWPDEQLRLCRGCGCTGVDGSVFALQALLGVGAFAFMLRKRRKV